MSIEKHRAFIDSLEGEKGLPEEMHGYRFDTSLSRLPLPLPHSGAYLNMCDYLMERCRRTESRQIPDLKEKVKEFGRDAMDAMDARARHQSGMGWTDANRLIAEFCALCAPDKGGEVKP